MSLLVSNAKNQIKEVILASAKKAISENILPEAELNGFNIEVPSNKDHGDYAVNAAMVWAKAFRNAPRKIAEILMENAEFKGTYIDRYEIAGPGVINFFLNLFRLIPPDLCI